MNSTIKFFALILFVAGTFAAQAAPLKLAVISDATTGVYKLVYRAAEAGKVKVSILNSAQEIIFTETLSSVQSFVRPYNFSNLTQGEYTIVVEDKNGKTEEHVSYYFKKVESNVDVTKIANESRKYLLSVENKETDLIDVKIIDKSNNVLHQQSMTVTGKFSVIYNLTSVQGDVTFEVTGSNGAVKTFNY